MCYNEIMVIGIRQLRQHASRYLDLVRAGETVQITDRGVLVALLAPPDQTTTGLSAYHRLIAAGHIIPAVRPFFPLPTRLPLPPGVSSQAVLDQQRSER